MTAVLKAVITTPADASFHKTFTWHSINWCEVTQNVRRLQVRIVKATQAGNRRKIRSLQRLLTRSLSAQLLAVKRVTENRGKGTAGVDGEIWNTPVKKVKGVERLRSRRYRAQPLRRVYILKSDGKRKRPLSIPTMTDRAYQALHLLSLDPVAETQADPNSYGFRRERSPADAIRQCHIILSRQNSAQWILEGDIKSCFDEIGHEWLEAHIPMDKHCLREWLKAGYMEQGDFHNTDEGVPQGGIASPVLANMTLDGLEVLLKQKYPTSSGQKVNLVRFADDFIITGVRRKLLKDEVLPMVESFLQERGLTLSQEKTTITHIEEGFDFLGQHIRKYKGTLRVKPSRRSQRAVLEKVRKIIKTEGNTLSAYGLINRLNPIIRGWANYHRHASSGRVFSRVSYQIFCAIWRWAKRRHRNKSSAWIRQKYFIHPKTRRKVFHSVNRNSKNEQVVIELFSATQIHYHPYTKIRKDSNPYDPAWEAYFEQRQQRRMEDKLRGRPELLLQWQGQRGLCPVCGELITAETGWHNHHIVWRVYGGGDEPENLVLLHPACHRQVHNPDYSGPSLRPSVMGV